MGDEFVSSMPVTPAVKEGFWHTVKQLPTPGKVGLASLAGLAVIGLAKLVAPQTTKDYNLPHGYSVNNNYDKFKAAVYTPDMIPGAMNNYSQVGFNPNQIFF